jgi:predicted dehydrogenase
VKRTRIAIVGLGKAARTIHLPAYRKLPNLEIVGGCDLQPLSERYHFPIFASPKEMLQKARPDILAVATPPASHFEYVQLGLEAGCHVFCEKPLANSLDEARQLICLANSIGKHVVVNTQYRFMNSHHQVQKRIGTAEFGDLQFLSIQQTFFTDETTEAGWRGQDKQRTCKEFGIHVLDLCRFFFDSEPIIITARMPKMGRPDGPDYLNLIQLEFPGERVAHITLDRVCRGRHQYLNIRLDGTNGCLETRLGGGIELATGVRGGSRRPFIELDFSLGGRARLYQRESFQKVASDPIDVFAQATSRLMQAFLKALETGRTPPCDASDHLRTLALVFAAYESDRLRRPIELKSPNASPQSMPAVAVN